MKFLKNLFSSEEETTDIIDNSDLNIAIIAILLRASSIDGNKDELELGMIKDISITNLNIKEDEFDNLYSRAIEEEDFSADIYKWTKIVNDNCDENVKLNILWLMLNRILN